MKWFIDQYKEELNMITIVDGRFCEADEYSNIREFYDYDVGVRVICERLAKNYKHEVGPNEVVNDEEVIRMAKILYRNIECLSMSELIECMDSMIEILISDSFHFNVVCSYHIAKVLFCVSKELCYSYKSLHAVETMVWYTKEALFDMFLCNRERYKYIAAAFYNVMGIEPYAAYFGFYDARHIYNVKESIGSVDLIDADYIVIPEVYAAFAIQMKGEGIFVEKIERYESICALAEMFWKIVYKKFKWYRYISMIELEILYYKATYSKREKWYGLSFVISDMKSKFIRQREIAKRLGYSKWNNAVDRRKLKTISIILLILCVMLVGPMIYGVISDGSWIQTTLYGIAFIIPLGWVFGMNEHERREENRRMQLERDIRNIAIASNMGIWYEPLHLEGRPHYYYHNYFRYLYY